MDSTHYFLCPSGKASEMRRESNPEGHFLVDTIQSEPPRAGGHIGVPAASFG